MWIYRSVSYKGHVLLNCNDPAHAQKNCVGATRARHRLMHVCGMSLTRSPLMLGRCPVPALSYVGKDRQSNREVAWCLNPSTIDASSWDAPAVVLLQPLGPDIEMKLCRSSRNKATRPCNVMQFASSAAEV